MSLSEAYARVERGEAWLVGVNIAPFEAGNRYNHEPKRIRKLLLHRSEIDELLGLTKAKGLTVVPLRLYITGRGLAKVELGLARGKQLHDKRRDIAERDARRDMDGGRRSPPAVHSAARPRGADRSRATQHPGAARDALLAGIQVVDAHAGGEPGRVIVGGVLDVPGATMFEGATWLRPTRRPAPPHAARAARLPGQRAATSSCRRPIRRPTPAS